MNNSSIPKEGYEVLIKLDKMPVSPAGGRIVALKDGRLMYSWAAGRVPEETVKAIYSEDGGKTWGEPVKLKLENGEDLKSFHQTSLFRMPSGAIGFVSNGHTENLGFEGAQPSTLIFSISRDEGAIWSVPVQLNPPGSTVYMTGSRTFVLKDGRIIVPTETYIGPKPDPALGNPKKRKVFGDSLGVNAPRCGTGFSYCYYSDDEGKSWKRSYNEAIALIERGDRGCYYMGEPSITELSDGRLLMFCRTNLGRVYQSISEDRGETWIEPSPTDLALLASMSFLTRIPSTGDLLVIWNQASRYEQMIAGYRHRLTCAVSQDEGKTWKHQRNLESLDDVSVIEADDPATIMICPIKQPTDRTRYIRAPGALRSNDPACYFYGDTAVITCGYATFGSKEDMKTNFGVEFDDLMKQLGIAPFERANKVRVLPIDWFYEK